jgi:hypothetical protein
MSPALAKFLRAPPVQYVMRYLLPVERAALEELLAVAIASGALEDELLVVDWIQARTVKRHCHVNFRQAA